MTAPASLRSPAALAKEPTAARGAVLQRKCACGTHTGGGTCEACKKDEDALQRKGAGPAPQEIPASVRDVLRRPGSALDARTRAFMEPRLGHDFSRVRVHADGSAGESAQRVNALAYTVGTDIVFAPGMYDPRSDRGRRLLAHELAHVGQQQSPGFAASASGEAETESLERDADTAAENAVGAGPVAPQPALLVDDEREEISPGQMRRSDFLARLRRAVRAAADEELRRIGRDTEGCPYIARWFAHYEAQPAERVERAARLFAPDARAASTASELIPAVSARIAGAVSRWSATGEVPDLPDGDTLADLAPDGLFSGLSDGLFALLGRAGAAVSGLGATLGRLFFKSAGASAPADARATALAATLAPDSGRPLEPTTRDRMQAALGSELAGVRVHTGSDASALNTRLGSRAFTLGPHVAFGPGEFQPGTPVGDALLAHELAHVAQQKEAKEAGASEGRDAALEADADEAAAGAVVRLWGRTREGLGTRRRETGPRLKTGLRLQGCGFTPAPVAPGAVPSTLDAQATKPCDQAERDEINTIGPKKFNTCCTRPMLEEVGMLHGQAVPRLDNATKLLEKPADAEEPLAKNFGIKPEDASRISTIRDGLSRIRSSMANGEGIFLCRRSGDPACKTKDGKDRRATTDVEGNRWITLCGDYDGSVGGGVYLAEPQLWIKTLIHEYAHLVGGRGMLTEDTEAYRGDDKRPFPPKDPDAAVRNPDSYAWFAMDASEAPPKSLPRTPLPPAPPTPTASPSCPPALGNAEWRVADGPRIFPSTSCDLQLVTGGGQAYGQHGMDFRGVVKAAPGCTGRVFFTQMVKSSRSWVECDEGKKRGTCSSPDWGPDTSPVYPYGTNLPVDGAAAGIPVSMFDSPGVNDLPGGAWPRSKYCIHDEFVSYLVYEDAAKKQTPLAWVHWHFTANAERDGDRCPLTHTAPDCSGWTIKGYGWKDGESFVQGAMGPRPLDASAPVVDKLAMSKAAKDCPPASCSAEATSGAPQGGRASTASVPGTEEA